MNQDQLQLPIQHVDQPILCSPYEEPTANWIYDTQTGEASKQPAQRGPWAFHECLDPQLLRTQLAAILDGTITPS